jgi:hypothetical protein
VSSFALADGERQAAVAALWAYRSETQHYLRSYDGPIAGHDDCCPVARARAARRAEEHEALLQRLREIDGALQTLDPEALQ